jgi:hypothetical protein
MGSWRGVSQHSSRSGLQMTWLGMYSHIIAHETKPQRPPEVTTAKRLLFGWSPAKVVVNCLALSYTMK